MSTTNTIKSYGRINTATIRACAKRKAFAKAMLLAYIDQRANIPWVFSICNIVNETGITEKTVKHYIKELVTEGVLQKVPRSQYKHPMRSNMTYYRLDKVAYGNKYWTAQEEPQNNKVTEETETCHNAIEKEGNEYRDKGVTVPDKGGKHSRFEGVNSSEKRGSHSDKGGNDSVNGGTGYLEKGVIAAPIYNRVEADVENRKKDREKERCDSLPVSLTASRFSEVIKSSVHPFSQPMFVKDPNSQAQRMEQNGTNLKESTKAENVTRSEAGQLLQLARPSEEWKDGNNTISAPSSIYKDSKPYNYTIDGETHEVRFAPQEDNATLSAIEKLTVFKHALVPFITIGEVDVPRASVLQVNGKSFELARQFFESNPAIPVSSLLKVIWECNRVAYENPVKESGFKPCFTHRAASESLTYLMKNLETINGTMPEEVKLPESTTFLTVE